MAKPDSPPTAAAAAASPGRPPSSGPVMPPSSSSVDPAFAAEPAMRTVKDGMTVLMILVGLEKREHFVVRRGDDEHDFHFNANADGQAAKAYTYPEPGTYTLEVSGWGNRDWSFTETYTLPWEGEVDPGDPVIVPASLVAICGQTILDGGIETGHPFDPRECSDCATRVKTTRPQSYRDSRGNLVYKAVIRGFPVIGSNSTTFR